jgi:cytochrome P450
MEPTARRAERHAANEAALDLMEYLRTQVAARRVRREGDVIGMLVAAEDGDELTEEELVAQLVLLFIAGHETTTHLIGNGALLLCRNPSELERLRSNPALIPSAIEEMLRCEAPANTIARVANEDIAVGGKVIPAGQVVLCMAGAANRDPAVFPDPDRFDVSRSPNPHLSFGGGPHFCLGAPLARLEGQIAFGRLLARTCSITAVEAGVRWRDLVNLRGLESLPLRVAWR